MNTEERIDDIIREHLLLPNGPINTGSNLVEDLDADSLDTVQIMMWIEDEFDISVDQDDFEELVTVGEVHEFVKRHIGEK